MDYLGNTYFKVKPEIIQCEKYLLKTLGLCVHVQHPHKVKQHLQDQHCFMYTVIADHHISSSTWNGRECEISTVCMVRYDMFYCFW